MIHRSALNHRMVVVATFIGMWLSQSVKDRFFIVVESGSAAVSSE